MSINTIFGSFMEELQANGFAAMPKIITVLYNEAMKLERAEALNAENIWLLHSMSSYERVFHRKDSSIGQLRVSCSLAERTL